MTARRVRHAIRQQILHGMLLIVAALALLGLDVMDWRGQIHFPDPAQAPWIIAFLAVAAWLLGLRALLHSSARRHGIRVEKRAGKQLARALKSSGFDVRRDVPVARIGDLDLQVERRARRGFGVFGRRRASRWIVEIKSFRSWGRDPDRERSAMAQVRAQIRAARAEGAVIWLPDGSNGAMLDCGDSLFVIQGEPSHVQRFLIDASR